eukprot:355315-Chlamydomonas_euryale.AAC.1
MSFELVAPLPVPSSPARMRAAAHDRPNMRPGDLWHASSTTNASTESSGTDSTWAKVWVQGWAKVWVQGEWRWGCRVGKKGGDAGWVKVGMWGE